MREGKKSGKKINTLNRWLDTPIWKSCLLIIIITIMGFIYDLFKDHLDDVDELKKEKIVMKKDIEHNTDNIVTIQKDVNDLKYQNNDFKYRIKYAEDKLKQSPPSQITPITPNPPTP